jgi:hypothetical protein
VLHVTPDVSADIFKAGVHAQMLGVSPATAYDAKDEIDKQLRAQGGDYDGELDDSIMNDIKVGWEGSIFGLHHREALPETVRNPGLIDKAVTGLTGLLLDSPFYVVGGLAGGAAGAAAGSEVPVLGNITVGAIGAGAGAFALPAALREVLTQGIQKGDVKGFGDLMHRAAAVTWAATKGAATGAAFEAAGGFGVGSTIAKSAVASTAVKGLYQATAMTVTGDLLDGRVPTASEFTTNAALIIPLNLITHGTALRPGEAKQASLDLYAKDGTTPQEMAEKQAAQPTVKPDMPPGLRPAIQGADGVVEADENETHAQLAERVLAKRPVTMEQLEADPTKADDVLEEPKIHAQDVIDRAWQLKSEAVEAGEVEGKEGEEKPTSINDLYDRAAMKSGRGFVTPDGKFLSRMEARKWVKDNEPDVHQVWQSEQGGDKQAELHSEDYAAARNRVQNRDAVAPEPAYSAMSPDLTRFLGENRTGILNKIKAGLKSDKYGPEAIRTLLVGPKAMLRAEGEQVVSRLRKLVPDTVDQEALHFARDYRDDPDALRSAIEEVRSGDNEKLKAFLPSMERALEPMSPTMQQADQEMTAYFQRALDLGRQVGTLDSGVDPSRYSPRLFMRAEEEARTGVAQPRFSDKTVNAIRRDYLHTLDPLKEGEVEARTFNAFDELSIYSDRHANAVSVKLFKTELKNSALGVEGARDRVPAAWVELDPAFREVRQIVDRETGESVTTSKNFYVPKQIADAVEPLFKPGDSQVSKFLHIQSVIKGIELTLSAFHMKAMGITALNNMGLGDFVKAMHSDNSSADFEAIERRGALYGLTTTKTGPPIEAYRGLEKSSLPDESRFANLKDTAVVQKVDAAFKGITKTTFDVIQRKFKVMDFAGKEAGWIAKHPEATQGEYAEAMRGYAKEVNAAYGGLNWEVMGVSKGMQNISRLFLLAPDWTFSNVANLKYAASDGGVAGAASRSFFAKSFVTGFAMTAAASIAIGGKYDPTDVKNIDRVYLGTDDDGKEMYANWFFAGAPKDATTLAKRVYSDGPVGGLAEFIVGKAGPAVGTVVGLSANKDVTGRPIYNREDDMLDQSIDQGKFVAGKVAPITGVNAVETVKSALTDPEHDYSYRDLLALAADALGSQTIHEGEGAKETPGGKQKQPKFSIRSPR